MKFDFDDDHSKKLFYIALSKVSSETQLQFLDEVSFSYSNGEDKKNRKSENSFISLFDSANRQPKINLNVLRQVWVLCSYSDNKNTFCLILQLQKPEYVWICVLFITGDSCTRQHRPIRSG